MRLGTSRPPQLALRHHSPPQLARLAQIQLDLQVLAQAVPYELQETLVLHGGPQQVPT